MEKVSAILKNRVCHREEALGRRSDLLKSLFRGDCFVIAFLAMTKRNLNYTKKLLIIAILIIGAGCGDSDRSNYYPYASNLNPNPTVQVTATKIILSQEPLRVGTPAQLYLAIINSEGMIVNKYTQDYTDPDTNEETNIIWSISDREVAMLTDSARLVPLAADTITVYAQVGEKEFERSIRIYEGEEEGAENLEEDVVGGGDEGDPEGNPEGDAELIACQTHADSILSFTPGERAGFGRSDYPEIVLGAPVGGVDVLSLGQYGEIVLDLGDCHLVDGPGVDLIIFENPFLIGGDPADPYAELAVVGVSTDGLSYVEFDCAEEAYPYTGCAGWNVVHAVEGSGLDPFDVDEAGGDHFDLADIGVDSARYIRIRDINDEGIGTDSFGFDLDAISVVNGLEY